METELIPFLFKGAPVELLWSSAILILIISALVKLRPYWEEIVPSRRALVKKRRKLEFLKLWFEVDELRKKHNLSKGEELPFDLLHDLQLEKPSIIQQEKTKLEEYQEPIKGSYHPFFALSPRKRGTILVLLLILSLVTMAALQVLGRPLMTYAAPSGMVSFELAGSLSRAKQMISSWGHEDRVYAALHLGLDFVFIIFYSNLLSLSCIMLSQTFQNRSKVLLYIGIILAWFQWMGGMFDVIENFSLIKVLTGTSAEVWPIIAKWCAVPKFTITFLGQIYIFPSLIYYGISRLFKGAFTKHINSNRDTENPNGNSGTINQ